MKDLYVVQTNITPVYARLDPEISIDNQKKHISSLLDKVSQEYEGFELPFFAVFDPKRCYDVRSIDTFEPGLSISESPTLLGFDIQNLVESQERNRTPVTAVVDYTNGNLPILEEALNLLSTEHTKMIPQRMYNIKKINIIE